MGFLEDLDCDVSSLVSRVSLFAGSGIVVGHVFEVSEVIAVVALQGIRMLVRI